jgi:hypothetical protein
MLDTNWSEYGLLLAMSSAGIHFTSNNNFQLPHRNQISALNDCLYHYKESSDFIFIVDPDELVFPQNGQTYQKMLAHLHQQHNYAAVFLFPMSHSKVTLSKKVLFSINRSLHRNELRQLCSKSDKISSVKFNGGNLFMLRCFTGILQYRSRISNRERKG